jgi:hypothetical protein
VALQQLFYRLSHASGTVDTRRLTRALGWSVADGMVQQDATELLLLLLEALGGALRPAEAAALQGLFTLELRYTVRCLGPGAGGHSRGR